MSKRLPVIFHNLHGYNSHLIFIELGKFDVKIDVIPNIMETYMAFILNKNIVFIDSMQFINSLLNTLGKKLNDIDLKHLVSKFGVEKLEL